MKKIKLPKKLSVEVHTKYPLPNSVFCLELTIFGKHKTRDDGYCVFHGFDYIIAPLFAINGSLEVKEEFLMDLIRIERAYNWMEFQDISEYTPFIEIKLMNIEKIQKNIEFMKKYDAYEEIYNINKMKKENFIYLLENSSNKLVHYNEHSIKIRDIWTNKKNKKYKILLQNKNIEI
ncbi:hypothetical protein [Hugenholtzia roseola]|uniref:hypothetical protein n=1 Tax=Hugenholtzia roseola TaxID=1002 RepID=UPI00047AE202|nr:hypothetical protein [Hugenholtzia roseola]